MCLCVVSCVWEAQRGWCMPSPAACTETFGETGEPRHHHVERAGAYTISALPLRRFNTLFEVDYFLTVFYSQRRSSSTSTLPYLLRPGWDMFGSSPELKEEAALPSLGWLRVPGCLLCGGPGRVGVGYPRVRFRKNLGLVPRRLA